MGKFPRRWLLRTAPLVAMPSVAGCNQPDHMPTVTLRMLRIINLSGRDLTIKVVAANAEKTETRNVLYSGHLGTQSGDAGAGEIVLQPSIDDPLTHDYRLSIADGRGARLPSRVLRSGYESESSDGSPGCLDLEFVVRDPHDETEVWGDYSFWESCETAPGTVDPSTIS